MAVAAEPWPARISPAASSATPDEVWKPYPPWPASQKNPVASASNPTTGTPSAASVRSPVQAVRTPRIPSVVIVLSRAMSPSTSPG